MSPGSPHRPVRWMSENHGRRFCSFQALRHSRTHRSDSPNINVPHLRLVPRSKVFSKLCRSRFNFRESKSDVLGHGSEVSSCGGGEGGQVMHDF